MICCTQTLGVSFGSGMVVPGTGVCLNDLHYFGDVDPAAPNALRPGMPLGLPIAPSIVTRAGKPVLALGTPGGYGICQTQAQVLVQYLDYGLPLAGRNRRTARPALEQVCRPGRVPHRGGCNHVAAGARASH